MAIKVTPPILGYLSRAELESDASSTVTKEEMEEIEATRTKLTVKPTDSQQ